ncbi:MAG: GNAT family N-acetyltransferase [Burkholderiaceae bacterium]
MKITRLSLENDGHRAALCSLLDEYSRSPEGGGHALAPQVLQALPARLATCPTYIGLLAWQGRTPAGLLNAFWSLSTFTARPLVNIHDIIVSASFRRQGVGRALITQIADIARELDCCKLTLEVLSGNLGALALYRSCGFEHYVLDPAMGEARFMQCWLGDPA